MGVLKRHHSTGRISRQVNFCTGSGFTRTSILDLLQFTRKLQIYSDFEKWETSLYVTQWINVTIKSIKRKYFFYKQAALAHSYLKPFRRFHEMTFFGRSRTIMIHISKKTTVESSNSLLFRWTKIFPFINCFRSFEDTLLKIVTLIWKLVVSPRTQAQLVSLFVAQQPPHKWVE